jgi:tetratricopeptide (TPR) repeat protein
MMINSRARCFIVIAIFILACQNNGQQLREERSEEDPLQELKQRVKQHPDSADLRIQLAYAYDSMGNYKEAISEMDNLIGKDSTNYSLWYSKGQILQDSGDTSAAIQAYSKAVKIYPAPDALLSLANLYAEQENERSLFICNQIKDMSLGKEYDAHCAFIAGIYYARKGRYEEALELFDECIRNSYTYMEAYIEKGLIYFDRRNYKDALKIFEFVSNVNNLYADAYYWMGRSYEMMDIRDSASLRYKQALSLDNTSVEAKKGLQRVSGK